MINKERVKLRPPSPPFLFSSESFHPARQFSTHLWECASVNPTPWPSISGSEITKGCAVVYVHGPPGMLTHFFMPLTPCISLAQCQVPSTVLVCSRNPQQQEFPKLLNFFFYNGMKIKHFRHLYFGKAKLCESIPFFNQKCHVVWVFCCCC